MQVALEDMYRLGKRKLDDSSACVRLEAMQFIVALATAPRATGCIVNVLKLDRSFVFQRDDAQ